MTTGKLDDNSLSAFINTLHNAFGDVTPALTEIAQIIVDSISENFDVGGRHGAGELGGSNGATGTWVPSQRALGKIPSRYSKKKGAGQTLQDTGGLAQSITYTISGQTIQIGSNKHYAAIHQFGGVINHPGGTPYIVMAKKGEKPRAHFIKKDDDYPPGVKFTGAHQIPIIARPFAVIQTPEDTDDIKDALTKYYARRLAAQFNP